jgi:U4/U6.U5 tri-snRNP-associated protein 3
MLPDWEAFRHSLGVLGITQRTFAHLRQPLSHSTHNLHIHPTDMSDTERPSGGLRERDSRREPREGQRERGNTPTERRNRSRSPRRDRGGGGGRRDARYRSRSPLRRDERDGGRAGDRGRGGRGREDRRGGSERANVPNRDRSPPPPKAPRPSGPRNPYSGPRTPAADIRARTPDVVKKEETPDVEMKDDKQKPEDMDNDTWEMMKTMGFGGFKTTKNTKVPGNDKNYGIRRDKTVVARQYMNRQGGFNRPLSPSRG